mmetsp:Transcript_104141/g.184945  ORF Transcript_104141/g.184945 Transcript_104141/m.184945 type:complete len:80 (-) Transcript_104141:47-286(-)
MQGETPIRHPSVSTIVGPPPAWLSITTQKSIDIQVPTGVWIIIANIAKPSFASCSVPFPTANFLLALYVYVEYGALFVG